MGIKQDFRQVTLRLKVEERLRFVIIYKTSKQTPFILKTFLFKCILNRVSIHINLLANKIIIKYVHQMIK